MGVPLVDKLPPDLFCPRRFLLFCVGAVLSVQNFEICSGVEKYHACLCQFLYFYMKYLFVCLFVLRWEG